MHIVGKFVAVLAVTAAGLTVAALPWILGGLVAHARLILLAGAVVSGALSILANLFLRRIPQSLPLILLPLAGLVLLGTIQLRPVDTPTIDSIQHSLVDYPATNLVAVNHAASIDPADTRTTIATLLATCILACVCFDHARSPQMLLLLVGMMLCNGVALAGMGLSELIYDTDFQFNDLWLRTQQNPFATFVNPNNAAGWLCLCFSVAAGWLVFQRKSASADYQGMQGVTLPVHHHLRYSLLRFLSDLTAWQVVAFFAVAFLGAAVAATRSRGGVLALFSAVTLATIFATKIKRLPTTLLLLAAGGLTVFGVLHWLELDQGVVAEIKTLRDLDKAAGGRPQHWKDSLYSVADFPLTGMGLGSYRYATLPYQSQHTELWFQNADNHFVDMAVEGGIIGFLLFVCVGIAGITTGLAGWRMGNDRESYVENTVTLSPGIVSGLGTAVMLAVLSQAASGFFDYGVAMPAAAALLVVVVASAAGCLDASRPGGGILQTGAVSSKRFVVVSVQLCLLSSAVTYLPDQFAASEIDKSVVTGTKLLAHEVSTDDLDQLEGERTLLEQRLSLRPDDPEGLRMMSRLLDAEFRWQVMQAEAGDSVRNLAGFGMMWRNFTLMLFVDRIHEIALDNPEGAEAVRVALTKFLDDTGLPANLEKLQARFPLMPVISESLAEIAVLKGDHQEFEQQMQHALFVEPANARTCFRLGALSLELDQRETAVELWTKAAELSPVFRGVILIDAKDHWSEDEAMDLFGPKDYQECVVAAFDCKDGSLKNRLFDRAEGYWNEALESDDGRLEYLRAGHLESTRRVDEAIEFLKSRVSTDRAKLSLRRRLARTLEKHGTASDAMAEWHTIQYLTGGDEEAIEAMIRLRERSRE